MILITGATGHLGSLTINALKNVIPIDQIAVLARTQNDKAKEYEKAGFDVRYGDYADYHTLSKAFEGVDKLFFISSGEAFSDFSLHDNVVKAAKDTGVKQIVYTSTQRSTPIDEEALQTDLHGWTETKLKQSGLNYVILRNSPYMESIPMILGENVISNGYHAPVGTGRVSFASRKDMAKASAVVLSSQGHDGKTYEFGGSESVSFGEIIKMIAEITGKPIPFSSPESNDYLKGLENAKLPEVVIASLVGFAEQINSGYFDCPSEDLERLLKAHPICVRDFLSGHYSMMDKNL